MKEISVVATRDKKESMRKRNLSAKQYFVEPLKSGLLGFAIFVTILIIVKLFSYAIGSYNNFTLEISDIQLSLVGFVLLFLIRFLENFKEKETN
mgnify:CR=1 FL=1